ncbi:hypothetical protein VS84_00438 [Vibrio cholerae]|nr:hypothetical protein VS84_00438 [Vibrio cholerae]KKP21710.1 hypothetical protein VS86_00359 [Vibrio cholerae]
MIIETSVHFIFMSELFFNFFIFLISAEIKHSLEDCNSIGLV